VRLSAKPSSSKTFLEPHLFHPILGLQKEIRFSIKFNTCEQRFFKETNILVLIAIPGSIIESRDFLTLIYAD